MAEGTRMIYLKADEELPYSEVMKVMDLAARRESKRVALIAEPRVEA